MTTTTLFLLEQRLLLLLLLAWLAVAAATTTTTSVEKRPHVIIIMADDFGFDDVSFRGGGEYLTPNIDALAYHGRALDRMYAPPMCTPSRAALLTGRYPSHSGMQHFVISNEEPWGLPTNITTIAQIFQSEGYATNLVGKWHQGNAWKNQTPTYRGFDYHYGYWGGFIDYYTRRSKMPFRANFSGGYDFRRNMELECEQPGKYVTDLLTEEAERVIEKTAKRGKSLFMMLSHLAPHTGNEEDPLQAPLEEIQKFAHIRDPNRRIYAAMVSKLDESVGRVVAALSRHKMLEDSIILFYSDNGAPSVGLFANSGSNWPFRGQKNTPWEGGIRVPGAIWSSRLAARGTIFRQPIYVGDLLPSLAHAAGIELQSQYAATLDGIDLWPQLSGHSYPLVNREILHTLDDVDKVSALLRGQFKYVNGTRSAGQFDGVLRLREIDNLDPRESRYVVAVRNSLVSRNLARFDVSRMTQARVLKLRADLRVKCGNQQRGCNSLIEECLYDIDADPCESNNLVYLEEYAHVLYAMRERVRQLRSTAWPPGNRPSLDRADPARHQCTWVNFEEENATNDKLECGLNALLPCASCSRQSTYTK